MANITPAQKELFEELHNSRMEDFKTFNKKSYRGVWSGIIDKYPESAHFVYELLQNADDAEATEVNIILKPEMMMLKHNGSKHFDITREDVENVGDINSITGIGDSSKANTQNKIGKFGVGFKAVFQYTNTPEIYDDYFKFKIENYIVPTLLDYDHPDRKEGETLFVFPFKDGKESYTAIKEKLYYLQIPILFLKHLQRITIIIEQRYNCLKDKEFVYSKEILDHIDYNDDGISLDYYRLREPNNISDVLLFSKRVRIKDKEGKISNHLINIGYYYDPQEKKLITNTTQNIFCFFPTKETFNTCFVAHAPFLLTDNRQNLKPEQKLNTDLINMLAELAAKALVYLRDYKIEKGVQLINENIAHIIPKYQTRLWSSADEFFENPIKKAFRNILKTERLLLSRNGKYLSLNEAYIGTPKELVDLLSRKQLRLLKNYSGVEKDKDEYGEDELFDADKIDFLKWELAQNISRQDNEIYNEINTYSSEEFAKDIDASFMKLQELRWVTRMYTFLRTAAPKLWKLTGNSTSQSYSLPFRYAPIIKTQKGEWVAPFIDERTPNVFLPLKENSKSNYNFISSEYLTNEIARKFFHELDLKEPDEWSYINQEILYKFKGEKKCIEKEELKTDFNILVSYYMHIKDKPNEESVYINQIKTKIYLCAMDGFIYVPTQMYFYNENLELYFEGKDDLYFLDLNFYDSAIQKYGITIVSEFMAQLGVKRMPSMQPKRKHYIHELTERIRKQISTYDYQEYHIEDFELEGFYDFCKNDTIYKEASLYLWNEILPSIKFSKYDHLSVVYRRKYARHSEKAFYTSSFKDALIYGKWLVDKEGYLVSAKEITLEDLAPEYDINNGLVQFLGIEKREKSIIELGGSEEQQAQFNIGKLVKDYGGNLTEEELIKLLIEANAKKNSSIDESINADTDQEETGKEDYLNKDKRDSTKKHKPSDLSSPMDCHKNLNKSDVHEEESENAIFSREQLRDISLHEMFKVLNKQSTSKQEQPSSEEDNDTDEMEQKILEQQEKQNKIKELREQASCSDKYTKEWFDALIELEYRGGTETEKDSSNKSINISFNSVSKEQGSERIYIFRNPSRCVPMWMEEIGDIEVKCVFTNREELKLKFEVANVRENNLRLKASKAYEVMLNKIDWRKCTKAAITLKNQIDLMGKVRKAFNNLYLDEGFNLKDNLQDNIQFIFGPPGTGKTTTLAKKIIAQMEQSPTSKILVLAPTNTACDELAKKIQEYSQGDCSWLHRFVSTADENLEDIVVDRDSLAYEEEKCCIVSTIARLSFDGFNGVNGNSRLIEIDWDTVICDEASMIPLAEIVIAIYTFVNTPIWIAGDPMQIKPILHEEEWKDENIYTMVKLNRFDNPKTEPIQFTIENLDVQYRSVPAIGELFSKYAYDGKLKHHRSALSSTIPSGRINLKPINFISFKVERFDSIFGIKKLDNSNVHIYSALFTVEMVKYLVKEYACVSSDNLSIGIVCPYSPQAQLIESLIGQIAAIPVNIKITTGTVHRFQGGQCKIMFVVLNPPLGMKNAADRIFLNNKNILNVAISRAQDYLCVLLPHRDTEGYENLYEINTIGTIAQKDPLNVAAYTCDQIEEIIFGKKFYIENNTFVTSHQLTNVYTKASKIYEVRIDEKSIDIQLGYNSQHKIVDDNEFSTTEYKEER